MFKLPSQFISSVMFCAVFSTLAICQDSTTATAKAPLDHVLGTITALDKQAHTVTVQEDKTGTVHLIQLENTKTLLKVEPSAKDLKSAVRITADDLESGDRVDIRGSKLGDTSTTLNARSVILMSGRALEQTHQQQAAAWAHALSGRVTAVDANSGKISADVRSAGAVKSMVVQTGAGTEFSRYLPETGKPTPSQISQIQIGDQVKVVGDKNDEETVINAQRVYSGAFRTVSATVMALGADGKSITVKDLSTKKDVIVALKPDAAIHKLPPTMAGMLARRLNPAAAGIAPNGVPGSGAPPASFPSNGVSTGTSQGGTPSGPMGGPGGPGQTGGRGNGDISQMIEHAPKIALSDLKPGDALVVSGVVTGTDGSVLVANTIIAGVEPILQSAPAQRGGSRSVGGDWGLGELSAPQ